MNSIKANWIGWGTVVVAAGTGAYLATKSQLEGEQRGGAVPSSKTSTTESDEHSDNVPSRPLSSSMMGGSLMMGMGWGRGSGRGGPHRDVAVAPGDGADSHPEAGER